MRSRCEGGWECVKHTWCAREASWGRGLGGGRVLESAKEERSLSSLFDVGTTSDDEERGRLQISQI